MSLQAVLRNGKVSSCKIWEPLNVTTVIRDEPLILGTHLSESPCRSCNGHPCYGLKRPLKATWQGKQSNACPQMAFCPGASWKWPLLPRLNAGIVKADSASHGCGSVALCACFWSLEVNLLPSLRCEVCLYKSHSIWAGESWWCVFRIVASCVSCVGSLMLATVRILESDRCSHIRAAALPHSFPPLLSLSLSPSLRSLFLCLFLFWVSLPVHSSSKSGLWLSFWVSGVSQCLAYGRYSALTWINERAMRRIPKGTNRIKPTNPFYL